MTDKPMTRKQVEDLIENVSLKFTQVVSEKLDEHGNKQKEEQRLARETTYEAGTGFKWEDRGDVKTILTTAQTSQKNSNLWKGAGVVAIIGLASKDIWEKFFSG